MCVSCCSLCFACELSCSERLVDELGVSRFCEVRFESLVLLLPLDFDEMSTEPLFFSGFSDVSKTIADVCMSSSFS